MNSEAKMEILFQRQTTMMMGSQLGSLVTGIKREPIHLIIFCLSDKVYNQITYYKDGTTRFWDNQNNSDVFGEHEFDFSGYSLVFDKQLPPQTDWTPPELTSFGELSETEVDQNQKFNISYSAFDADSELNDVQFNFRNENGNTFQLNDYDDDGIASGEFK